MWEDPPQMWVSPSGSRPDTKDMPEEMVVAFSPRGLPFCCQVNSPCCCCCCCFHHWEQNQHFWVSVIDQRPVALQVLSTSLGLAKAPALWTEQLPGSQPLRRETTIVTISVRAGLVNSLDMWHVVYTHISYVWTYICICMLIHPIGSVSLGNADYTGQYSKMDIE